MKIARIALKPAPGASLATRAEGVAHRACPGCHAPLGAHETICRHCEATRHDLDEAGLERFGEGYDE
jgi:hypothetical protein